MLQVQSAETGGSEGSQTSLCPQGGIPHSSTLILLSHGNCFICLSRPIAQHPSVWHTEPNAYHIPFIAMGKNSVPITYLKAKSPSHTFVPVPFCTPQPNPQKKPPYTHTLASSSPIYTPDRSLTPASVLIFLQPSLYFPASLRLLLYPEPYRPAPHTSPPALPNPVVLPLGDASPRGTDQHKLTLVWKLKIVTDRHTRAVIPRHRRTDLVL